MAIEEIVVVDHEMMIRNGLETQMRVKSYSVAFTGELKRGRKILHWDSIDLILLDFSLPDAYFACFKRKLWRGPEGNSSH